MIKRIGLFDAKTNLSKIAERVRRTGQPVTLTKRGQPYVDLVPHQKIPTRRSKMQVLAELDQLRRQMPKSSAARIKADIETGRQSWARS
jgi:prevent-host-death family protein